MKTFNKTLWSVALVMGLLLYSSCSSFVEGYANDPNEPTDVPESLLLPSAEIATGLVYGTDLTWYSATFIQTQAGTARQMNAASRYNVVATDVNNPWSWAYADALMDLKQLKDKAVTNGNSHYVGAANVLTSLILGILVDSFGDIPYSEALQGADDPTPIYDDAAGVYTTIHNLLDEAISSFAASSPVSPSTEDLIYGGDVALWTKAAYALKARYYLHTGDYANAITAAGNGFSAGAEDMEMVYGTADPQEANPWYQFNTQRGDLSMHETFVDLLKSLNDPRLPFYATTDANGEYNGTNPDSPDPSASMIGAHYASISSGLPLVTYTEQKFIEAEARFQTNDAAGALTALNAAVEASLTDVTGASDPAFIANTVPGAASGLTLESIMTHKYIAMFSQFESWTDIRRTNLPTITPYGGNAELPSRYPYPQRERDLNPDNVPAETGLFGKIFWDN